MRNFLPAAAVVACLFCSATVGHGQVLFNDTFNGTNVTTNNGTGAVNPTSSSTVFNSTGINPTGSTAVSQNSAGAYYAPTSSYNAENLTSTTGNTDGGTAYALTSVGTQFSFTLNNVVVSSNGSTRSDIPNSSDGGFRFELGLFSANFTGADPELYANTAGGMYVYLFYDKQGNLTGNLRATDSTKPANADASGTTGIFELASFSIPQRAGTTNSFTSPLTVSFTLTNTAYAVTFNQAATVSSGSLSGTFNSVSTLEQTNLDSNGVRINVLGQGWTTSGDGTANLTAVNIAVTPEPSTFCMIGLGLAAVLFVRRARRNSRFA